MRERGMSSKFQRGGESQIVGLKSMAFMRKKKSIEFPRRSTMISLSKIVIKTSMCVKSIIGRPKICFTLYLSEIKCNLT